MMIISSVTLSKSLNFPGSQSSHSEEQGVWIPRALPALNCVSLSLLLVEIWGVAVHRRQTTPHWGLRTASEATQEQEAGPGLTGEQPESWSSGHNSHLKTAGGGGHEGRGKGEGSQAARAAVPSVISKLDRCP